MTTTAIKLFRERKRKAGLAELRGVYAPRERHAELKEALRELLHDPAPDATIAPVPDEES